MNENSVLIVLKINECGEILINFPKCLLGTNVNNTFDAF